ncbi:MAG: hypothetical protein HY558_07020 [Euryarchaeota archaeon]|nr:hypothetical protein [Euryarchaeota archaeon]
MVSNLSISASIAIGLSSNLSQGIRFGSLSPGVSNQSAAAPDGTDGNTNQSGQTGLWVNVSSSGPAIDLCLGANRSLRDDSLAREINNTRNYTLAFHNSTNNLTLPGPMDRHEMPLALTNFSETGSLSSGSRVFLRFWLDVPDNQPAGAYTSNVTFRGVLQGSPCGSL